MSVRRRMRMDTSTRPLVTTDTATGTSRTSPIVRTTQQHFGRKEAVARRAPTPIVRPQAVQVDDLPRLDDDPRHAGDDRSVERRSERLSASCVAAAEGHRAMTPIAISAASAAAGKAAANAGAPIRIACRISTSITAISAASRTST